jgi:ketosteroid isomerase-like protein
MRAWLVKKVLEHNMARLREGDYEPTLRLDAKNVKFRFPGNNSWSTELKSKEELERWLQRLVDVGIQLFLDDVVLKGFPWKMTVSARGRSLLDSPQGEHIYENRYVIWGTIRWGLLREYEVYEDTQKAAKLDEYLTGIGKL